MTRAWKRGKAPPHKRHQQDYRQLFRVVDGAVADAIMTHPEFFALGRQRSARASIAKRVAGAIVGYIDQRASSAEGSEKGRSGANRPAASKGKSGASQAGLPTCGGQ